MSFDEIEDLYQLSPMQQGVLFESLYSPGAGAYIEQRFCVLRGGLNLSAFKRAWHRVVERYAVLRTAFVWEGIDEPVQVVHRGAQVPFDLLDWREFSVSERQSRLAAYLEEDRRRGFELSEAPLMRLALVHCDESDYQFIWTYHHLLLDGWSWPLLVREVFTFYECFSKGTDIELKPPRQYREYIAWLREQNTSRAEDYWRATLKGFNAPVALGIDKRVEVPRERLSGRELNVRLPSSLMEALVSFGKKHQLTLYTVIQGIWALLLNRYSRVDDIVFGAVVSGRPPDLPEVESMVGLFINTLPVRVWVPRDMAVLSWLKELQARQAESRQYEYSSLVQVQGWSEVPRGTPLFETILVFENYPIDFSSGFDVKDKAEPDQDGLEVSNLQFAEEVNYPLSLVVTPGSHLAIRLLYDSRRFDEDTVSRIADHLQMMLESIISDPRQKLSSIEILTQAERDQILFRWNDRTALHPSDKCIHELFEGQVEKLPDATAIEFEGQSFSYGELNSRANRVAHKLCSIGVGPEVRVGLCLDRSPELIIALMGVLKSGATYVPFAPSLPIDRLAFMMEDAQIQVLLTTEGLLDNLPSSWAQVVCLDSDRAMFETQDSHNLDSAALTENGVYVVYTSGSTGSPKAVMVTHRALVNNISAMNELYGLNERDRMLQFVSISFDVFAQEVFTALTSGAALIMHRNPTGLGPLELVDFCEKMEVSVMHMPPPYWHQMVDELWNTERSVPETLRLLVVGAESPSAKKLARWSRLSRHQTRFINAYGPAEAAITNATFEASVDPDAVDLMTRIPIGRPVANNRLYLLDENLAPVPVGITGNLFIGGDALARCYLNRPGLTAEKFIPDPYGARPGARLYSTGDTARFRLDGQIEFIGRNDNQVKLRGFRIELGEIEVAIRQHHLVKEAASVVREDTPGERQLVGYVTLTEQVKDERDALSQIIGHLRRKLPGYMVPSPLVVLSEMPLTPNGKIDRKSLPKPGQMRTGREDAYVPPRSAVEEVLAEIWSKVLGVERVGVYDSFFDLGGHSLLATQIISRVRDYFQVEVPLSAVFESPTVAGLALAVTQQQFELEESGNADLLLEELESLSDEEVERLLKSELNLTQDE
ncbi:MAG: amino acid adenylation domain-containing protein [Blastocatellia bacterium]|nr:amino acid adenylation domain-containing protein [Blastocatellia bacterium]